jgi:L-amino acid N-acyltransferase YncA
VLARGLPWLVAEKGRAQVLGFAYANWFKPRPAYRFSAEDSIYVCRQRHGHGRGPRKLLAELAVQAEAAGVRKLLAVIGDSANAGSIGVHRALGFTDVGRCDALGGLEVRRLARHRADGKDPGRGRHHLARIIAGR